MERWYRETLVETGLTVVNENDGREIAFDGGGAKKTKQVGDELLSVAPAIPDILRLGEPIGEPAHDRKDRRMVWHRYGATVEVKGKPVNVLLTVRERPDGSFHYSLNHYVEMGVGAGPSARSVPEGSDTSLEGDPDAKENIAPPGEGVNPDDDPLLQRGRAQPQPRLRATHSLSIRNLREALNTGALVAPSVAIQPQGVAHRWAGPGGADVILKAGAIRPRSDNVTAGDAWTPTHPPVVRVFKGKRNERRAMEERFAADLAALPEAARGEYFAEVVRYPTLFDYRGRLSVDDVPNRPVLEALYRHRTGDEQRFPFETEAGEAWLSDYVETISGGRVQQAFFDGTTNAGRPIYKPVTPANIIRRMKKDWRERGIPMGPSETAGRLARPLRTLTDIRSEAGRRVVGREAYAEGGARDAKTALSEAVYSWVRAEAERGSLPSHADPLNVADVLADMLVEAGGNPDRAARAFQEHYEKVGPPPDGWADSVREALSAIQDAPLPYLEAKPMRQVPLSDIAAVVVPPDTPQDLRDRLAAQGIEVREKREGMSDEELAEAQNAPGALFQRGRASAAARRDNLFGHDLQSQRPIDEGLFAQGVNKPRLTEQDRTPPPPNPEPPTGQSPGGALDLFSVRPRVGFREEFAPTQYALFPGDAAPAGMRRPRRSRSRAASIGRWQRPMSWRWKMCASG